MRQDSIILKGLKGFENSYRTIPEQVLGLCIFFCVSITCCLIHLWVARQGLSHLYYEHLDQVKWILSNWGPTPIWFFYYLSCSFSAWLAWRKSSIYQMKLEVSLLLSQFFWLLFWIISFYSLQIPLLSLFSLLFSLSSMVVYILVLQKNEKLTRFLLAPAFFWLFYMTGINMMYCVSTPLS